MSITLRQAGRCSVRPRSIEQTSPGILPPFGRQIGDWLASHELIKCPLCPIPASQCSLIKHPSLTAASPYAPAASNRGICTPSSTPAAATGYRGRLVGKLAYSARRHRLMKTLCNIRLRHRPRRASSCPNVFGLVKQCDRNNDPIDAGPQQVALLGAGNPMRHARIWGHGLLGVYSMQRIAD